MEDIPAGDESRAFKSTAPRFDAAANNVPGPGSYDHHRATHAQVLNRVAHFLAGILTMIGCLLLFADGTVQLQSSGHTCGQSTKLGTRADRPLATISSGDRQQKLGVGAEARASRSKSSALTRQTWMDVHEAQVGGAPSPSLSVALWLCVCGGACVRACVARMCLSICCGPMWCLCVCVGQAIKQTLDAMYYPLQHDDAAHPYLHARSTSGSPTRRSPRNISQRYTDVYILYYINIYYTRLFA